MKSVFDYINNRKKISIKIKEENRIGFQSYEFIKYNNFDEYLKENPDCCAVNPGGGYDLAPPSIVDQLLGFNSGDVIVIEYEARYFDNDGRINTQKVTKESFVQNCGKINQ